MEIFEMRRYVAHMTRIHGFVLKKFDRPAYHLFQATQDLIGEISVAEKSLCNHENVISDDDTFDTEFNFKDSEITSLNDVINSKKYICDTCEMALFKKYQAKKTVSVVAADAEIQRKLKAQRAD